MTMSVTDSGHIIHAQGMFGQTYHLAWGKLSPGYADPWTVSETPPPSNSVIITETKTRGAGATDTLVNGANLVEVVAVKQGGTTYTPGSDYNVVGTAIDWSPPGQQPGTGTSYDVIYRYTSTNILTLLNEIARREASLISYVTPDVNGDIEANGQKWSLTGTPTRYLYLQFKFASDEAVGETIYQLGICIGTTKESGVPSGQKYLLPADVDDPGKLYTIENVPPFARFTGKREQFEFVLTF